jgi:hypothetical protein
MVFVIEEEDLPRALEILREDQGEQDPQPES